MLEARNGWEIAFWFAGVNSYLGGRAPKEVVANQPEAVLKAAKTEAIGLQHGKDRPASQRSPSDDTDPMERRADTAQGSFIAVPARSIQFIE